MKPAQAVTKRYVSNLLKNGRNKEFELTNLECKDSIFDDVVIGVYFEVRIDKLNRTGWQRAAGASPSQAVQRALQKHGVTFR